MTMVPPSVLYGSPFQWLGFRSRRRASVPLVRGLLSSDPFNPLNKGGRPTGSPSPNRGG